MIYQQAYDWMFHTALPFWARAGVDHQYGGFVESLTLDGKDSCAPYKRTRVTARQIYVFSYASLLGVPGAIEIVNHGLEHLTEKAWIENGKGFARTVHRQSGTTADGTPDLYDHAFALFALGWAYRATGDKALVDWMHKTLDHIEALFVHPSGIGYAHDAGNLGWRQQNPHMHLLEGALVASEATGETTENTRFRSLAGEISNLFVTRLFDSEHAVLPEFFDDHWTPAAAPDGTFFEPGHQFEWAWILQQGHRILGTDNSAVIRQLITTAEHAGVDPATAATYNQVNTDGSPRDRGSRTWPNTERIKAAVALFELDGINPVPVFEQSAGLLLGRYLNRQPAGTWIDLYDDQNQPLSDFVPASTLYHVILAFAEMLRIGSERGEFSNIGNVP